MTDYLTQAALEQAQRSWRQMGTAMGLVKPKPHPFEQYDLHAAIRLALSGHGAKESASLESVVHDTYLSRGYKPVSPYSVFLPRAALGLTARAAYETGTATAGAELVETTLTPSLFIDALRPASRVLALGAQVVGGLKGDVQIPREATASTASWQATPSTAPAAAAESEAAFDTSPLTVAPAVLVGYGKASRLLMQQGGQLANAIISQDINRAIGTAVDAAAVAGSGSGGAPQGLVGTAGVNTQSGASLGLVGLVASITAIANANALVDPSTLGWLTTPNVASLLTQKYENASNVFRLWRGNVDAGTIDNIPARSTTNCPAATAIAGCWSQLVVLLWGTDDEPLELEVNRFSANFAGGDIQFRIMLLASLAVRHPQSFTVVSSIT